MADATLVLLVILAGPAGSAPINGANVGSAVRDALGETARVVVDDRRGDLSDADAAAAAARMRADAVAAVAWVDVAATRSHVRMFVSADGGFYDRDLVFAPADAMTERERAIGFLVGAMVRGAREDAPSTAPPPTPVAPAPPTPGNGPPERPRSPVEDAVPRAPSTAARRAFSLDAGAAGSAGLGGAALGIGPSVRLGWRPVPIIALRAGGSVLFGSIDPADATTIASRVGAGFALRAASFGRDGAWTVEVGVTALAVNHRVAREAPAVARDRWLTGGQLGGRLGWRASEAFEPFVAVAAEVVSGTTPIVVGARTTGEIPLARAVAELGFAAHF